MAEVIIPLPADHFAAQGPRVAESQHVQTREFARAVCDKVLAGHLLFALSRTVDVQGHAPGRFERRRRVSPRRSVRASAGIWPAVRLRPALAWAAGFTPVAFQANSSFSGPWKPYVSCRPPPTRKTSNTYELAVVDDLGQLGIEHLLGDGQRLRALTFVHVEQAPLAAAAVGRRWAARPPPPGSEHRPGRPRR